MFFDRLVRTIEDHAEDLTSGVLTDLQANPHTPAYHGLMRDELHDRVYNVYHHLGRWVGARDEAAIEAAYSDLGRRRHAESIPLAEVVYALIVVKDHLRDYIRHADVVDNAVQLYQEEELNRMVGHFFDKAIYFTVKGYEGARAHPAAP